MFPVEIRVAAADDIWLSTAYGRDSAYVAIHQYVGLPYQEYFRLFESIAGSAGGRPHWGKMHTRDAAYLAGAYPRFADFLAVRDETDPSRRVRQPLPGAGLRQLNRFSRGAAVTYAPSLPSSVHAATLQPAAPNPR